MTHTDTHRLARATKVIGLKVVNIETGEELDKVTDVLYDPAANAVVALLVDEGGWFSDAKIILTRDLTAIGDNAVTVSTDEVIRSANEISDRITQIAENKTYLTQTRVLSRDGDELGRITDLFFDTRTGRVEKLLVSQGLLENIKSGQKEISIADIEAVGDDYTVVTTLTKDKFAQQADEQGLQGAVNTARHKAGELVDTVREKAPEVAADVKETVQQGADEVRMRAQLAKQEVEARAEDFANKPSTKNKVERGKFYAQQALEKGEELADKAKAKGQEYMDMAEDKYQQAREQAPETYEEVKDKAEQKLNEAENYTETKSKQVQTEVRDQRKGRALGRYATKNILTPDDEVLAERGDVITNEVLERAESYDMLEQVLGNTSERPPQQQQRV